MKMVSMKNEINDEYIDRAAYVLERDCEVDPSDSHDLAETLLYLIKDHSNEYSEGLFDHPTRNKFYKLQDARIIKIDGFEGRIKIKEGSDSYWREWRDWKFSLTFDGKSVKRPEPNGHEEKEEDVYKYLPDEAWKRNS